MPQGTHNRQRLCCAMPAALQAYKTLYQPSATELLKTDNSLAAISCIPSTLESPDKTGLPTLHPCDYQAIPFSDGSAICRSVDFIPEQKTRLLQHRSGTLQCRVLPQCWMTPVWPRTGSWRERHSPA